MFSVTCRRTPAWLIAFLLLALALAACAGGASPDSGADRAERAASSATEPDATPRAVPNQASSSATPRPDGTGTPEEAGGVIPKLAGAGGSANTQFASVSAGHQHTCGVRTDGSAACWGEDEYGKATLLAGEFTSVSVGYKHTCGVRTCLQSSQD